MKTNGTNEKRSGNPQSRVLSLVLVIVAIAATPATAEVFDEGDVILETQAQVDNFSYTEVTGNLSVWDDGTDPITNLDGLSGLTSVGGSMNISGNDSLTNLDGLSGLTSVGGIGLKISDNETLTDVDGLSSLTSLEGSLWIQGNDSLTDVDGLSGLTSVGGFVAIVRSDSLTDVDGLSSLTSVGASLGIERNESLTEFCGLHPLLAADGLAGGYFVSNNAANPTQDQILAGGPCDPADTIAELFAEHVIKKSEAQMLQQLADDSLEELADFLTLFVEEGTLAPSEAQLLFVIASNWQEI